MNARHALCGCVSYGERDHHIQTLASIDIRIAGPNSIEATWELGGYLKLPWNPRIEMLPGASSAHGG